MGAPQATLASRGGAYLAVVLAAAYFLAFLDRQSLNLFVVPIEHDLNISDFQMSLLLGLAFGMLYSVLGIPFGILADHANRRRLVIAGVTCWSLATLVSALATGPLQMFIGRIGVGIGEATLAPAAASMIADSFLPAQRGRAFGIFSIGTTFGSGAASLLGAGIAVLSLNREIKLPALGALHAWQVTLLVVALAGVPIIVALLGVREPQRIARRARSAVGPTLHYLRRHWRLYGLIYLANVIASLMSYSFYPWVPAAMERAWHLSRGQIGVHLGVLILVLSTVGIYTSGWLVDRLSARGMKQAVAGIGTIVFLILAVIAASIFRMPSERLTWLMIGAYILLVHIYFPYALLALTAVTPPPAMATVSAVNFMCTGVFGLSLGPILVVLVSHHFFSGALATGYALSSVCTALALLGALCYAALYRPLREFSAPVNL